MATTTRPTSPPVAPVNDVPRRKLPWFLDLYRTAVGKKYVMALTGLAGLGFVLLHMVGNLKMYLGAEDLDHYAEFLRDVLVPILPRTVAMWLLRGGLVLAVLLHLHAAWSLTRMNMRSNRNYVTKRDWVAADFASRTMRWTGIIVVLFIVFHLFDLTWGQANPDFERGHVYDNVVASFERVPVAIAYVIANLALGVHLWHGVWSLFQSMGWNNPRFNRWREWASWGFAGIVVAGNVSFPIAVMIGVVG